MGVSRGGNLTSASPLPGIFGKDKGNAKHIAIVNILL
jgi:hypothetical protein